MVRRAHAASWPPARRQDLLPAVVPDRVEPSLRVQPAAQVAVGGQDRLLVVQRARDHFARGRLDHRDAAAAEHILARRERHREVVRERVGGDELRNRHHERARLDRDVPHRGEPSVGVIGGRRHPDLGPAAVHAVARKRHPVLPADQAADPRAGRLHNAEVVAGADPVKQALVLGRHQLAVARQQPGRAEIHDRVVDGARPLGLALVDADARRTARARGRPSTRRSAAVRARRRSSPTAAPRTRSSRRSPPRPRAQAFDGYSGTKHSGSTASCAPRSAASCSSRCAFSIAALGVEDHRRRLDRGDADGRERRRHAHAIG